MTKLCPACGYNLENNTSRTACDVCQTPFATEGSETPEVDRHPTPAGLPGEASKASDAKAPKELSGGPNEAAFAPSPVPVIAAAEEPAKIFSQAGFELEPEHPPEPEPRQRFSLTSGNITSTTATSSEAIGPDEIDAKNAFESGKRIITVIGFANSGKSFFVNRLRHDLAQGPWRCAPGPQEMIATSPEGLELTRLTPFKQRRGQALRYVVVDLAGESFMKALDNRQGQEIAGFSIHSYLAAMAFASAYIFLIRFEDIRELVDGAANEEAKKVRNLLRSFHDILGCIAISAGRLRRGRAQSTPETPEQFLAAGITKEELDDAFDRKIRCDKPICVLFSQADRVAQVLKIEEYQSNYDCDPLLFAMKKIPELYNPISDTFRDFRFDFLSAFEGHVPGPQVNYELLSHGALEAFLWVHGLLDRGHSLLGWPSRLARGLMPTRQAIRVRRWLDPQFGEVLRRIERRGTGL